MASKEKLIELGKSRAAFADSDGYKRNDGESWQAKAEAQGWDEYKAWKANIQAAAKSELPESLCPEPVQKIWGDDGEPLPGNPMLDTVTEGGFYGGTSTPVRKPDSECPACLAGIPVTPAPETVTLVNLGTGQPVTVTGAVAKAINKMVSSYNPKIDGNVFTGMPAVVLAHCDDLYRQLRDPKCSPERATRLNAKRFALKAKYERRFDTLNARQ